MVLHQLLVVDGLRLVLLILERGLLNLTDALQVVAERHPVQFVQNGDLLLDGVVIRQIVHRLDVEQLNNLTVGDSLVAVRVNKLQQPLCLTLDFTLWNQLKLLLEKGEEGLKLDL